MNYPGGKAGSGTFQTIINLMPPHEVYIEPFLGGGAIMRVKRPAGLNIGLDLDAAAVAARKREYAGGIAGNGDLGSTHAGNGGPRVSLKLAKAAGTARNGDASGSAAGNGECRSLIARSGVGRRHETSEMAMRTATPEMAIRYRIEQGDGIALLESYKFTGKELVYCDPPYLMSTRKGGKLYDHEMSDVDHRRLLRVLRDLKCMVMISGYSSVLYAKELKGWNATAYHSSTRRGLAAEWIWYNFPRPTALHDYRFLGNDCREREKIRRQQKRWAGKLQRMNVLQRQALLSAIAGTAGFGEATR